MSDRKFIVILPGLMVGPSRYTPFAEAITKLGRVHVYCPPGVHPRRGEACAPRMSELAADVAAQVRLGGWDGRAELLVIGHSWGSHLARNFVADFEPNARLVEIDPRLRQVVQNPEPLDSHPVRFASRAELVAAYAEYGVDEPDIGWDRWVEDGQGGYEIAFAMPQMRQYLLATYSEPHDAWRQIGAQGGRKPMVLRTGGFSLNDDALWAAAKQGGLVEVRVLDGVLHDLIRIEDQETAASVIVDWCNAL